MRGTRKLQDWLAPGGAYSTFNREERNVVATLYAALLHRGNLEKFAACAGWQDLGEPALAELFVEWSYARDMWDGQQDAGLRRDMILTMLSPSEGAWLRQCSIEEFNDYFGVRGTPSKKQIQYPGSWSLKKFADRFVDEKELRRTCLFKWAFNIKPDLVIHGSSGGLLCVETKWLSVEGKYPTAPLEVAIFKERELEKATQTQVQQYLVQDLLGYRAAFCFVVRKRTVKAAAPAHTTLTWEEAFAPLELGHLPAFIQTWVDTLTT